MYYYYYYSETRICQSRFHYTTFPKATSTPSSEEKPPPASSINSEDILHWLLGGESSLLSCEIQLIIMVSLKIVANRYVSK